MLDTKLFPSLCTLLKTQAKMGDCRIRIQYDASLETTNEAAKGREMKTLIDQSFASDSTVHEVLLAFQIKGYSVLQLIEHDKVCLWDFTVYPAVNVTKKFDATTTLFTAGWFPSARLHILPMGKVPLTASANAYDDEPNTILEANDKIQHVSRTGQVLSGRDKPSQLLQSAIDTSIPQEDEMAARIIRNENRQNSALRQKERLERLQKQIQTLEQKSGKTSIQVRKMLIKSRATGRQNLIDRLHFKCYIVLDDDEVEQSEEEYRFFSPQDTAGKVVESFSQNRGARRGELLVTTKSGAYLRLPTLMRLYEAIEANYVEDFMTVVIRFYDTGLCLETPNIEEGDKAFGSAEQICDDSAPATTVAALDKQEVSTTENFSAKTLMTLPQLAGALTALDSKAKKSGSSKPKTTTVDKVKQMQLKARAKGDGKRVKLPDRFYFELVVVTKDCHIDRVEPVFLAQSDPLSRILRDHVAAPGRMLVHRVADSCASFQMINDTSICFEDAIRKGVIAAFGRIIVLLDE
ncbi:hypothetical protein FisN_18Hh203 [Fistulifera solaris]|uniref:Uncharacterized protein n=1 Tax=Fistulifera solaris TaxID=1519565 RepID=A0A1Z5JVB4_FISSO|nr:hypothetical protein FisN_18Hh203 [Fistulifera solaris]|eukprot:GAX17990.1 hypothetical protein FisN_18Hh203 [Fistulifera solaris]